MALPPSSPPPGDLLAAIDLGSNSFHLAIARRLPQGGWQLLHAESEKVQLAAGLNDDNCLDAPAQARGLSCLQRFATLLQAVPAARRRAVGTQALRLARNACDFTAAAHPLLQTPVHIISGEEEARLIYRGVSRSQTGAGRRLVIDIGGGSTECMLGDGPALLRGLSLNMGCVTFSRRFFADGRLNARALQAATAAARAEVERLRTTYQALGWQQVLGASGTIKAVSRLQQQLGLATAAGHISLAGLHHLRSQLLTLTHIEDIKLPGLSADRRALLPAGLALLLALFEGLDFDAMAYTDGALREGLLQELYEQLHHDTTV